MTDQNLTHIYFLLDRSGSMASIKTDIEGGFAAFVDEQRAAPGDCRVTLAKFDTEYKVVFVNQPLTDIPPLHLRPRGSTALLDAMGRLITDSGRHLAAMPEEQRPGTVIVAIMTDGLENSSRHWTYPRIKALVEQQSRDYGWQFLYMGADQDAIEVGSQMGIDPGYAVTYGRGRSREAMASASARMADVRGRRRVDPQAPMDAFTPEERRSLAK